MPEKIQTEIAEEFNVEENEVELIGEDPDADYSKIIECIREDLETMEVL